MEKEQHRAAKGRMMALMQAGHSWQEAASLADIQISRSAAYRLLQKVRTESEKLACKTEGMGIQPNCVNLSSTFSKTPARRLQTRQAMCFSGLLKSTSVFE